MFSRFSVKCFNYLKVHERLLITKSAFVNSPKYSTVWPLNERYHQNTNTWLNSSGQRYRYESTVTPEVAVPVVSYDEINRPEVTLIDVREPNELQETGIIPSSINIPLGEVTATLGLSDQQFEKKYKCSKPKQNAEIIFFCRAGIRAEQAAIQAIKLGFTNVKNYKGSWLDYAERHGLPK